MKTDQAIHIDVMEALAFEPQLDAQLIAVAVKDGIVALSGEVENHAQKGIAEQVVKSVIGVRGFTEALQVNPPAHHHRTDQEIAQAALDALKWNVLVPAELIQVKVEHGWLTLFGDVLWQFERQSAEDAVKTLTGVRGMSNKITIKPRVPPRQVKDKIVKAFERSARQEAHDINVKVDGGIVTLEGTVHNWVEYDDAERAAWAVAGISDVHNMLMVNVTAARN